MSRPLLVAVCVGAFALWWDFFAAPVLPPSVPPNIEVFLGNCANYSVDQVQVGELRVGVGYNANLDLVVNAGAVFELLLAKHASPTTFHDHETISSVEELFASFGYWFSQGGAAERYVSSPDVFLELLNVAKQAGGHVALGGNAGLMANTLAEAGHHVLLGAVQDQQIKGLLHPRVTLTESKAMQTTQSGEAEGLYHLILEYPKGANILGVTASRANRMILIRDHLNSRLESLPSFHHSLVEFDPDVVVVSGLHLLSGTSFEDQERQLKKVVQALSTVTASVPIHLELASMADARLMALVVHNVLPYVDSLGLNEQELNATVIALNETLGPGVTPSDPRGISSALQAIHTIFAAFRFPAWSSHFLTRIHFHCLAFHAVAQRNDILGRTRWGDASDAVFQGARTASVRACGEDGTVRPEHADLLFRQKVIRVGVANERFEVNMEAPVTTFELTSVSGMKLAVAPVAVCKKPTRTVGLGDAISAAGLIRHVKITH